MPPQIPKLRIFKTKNGGIEINTQDGQKIILTSDEVNELKGRL